MRVRNSPYIIAIQHTPDSYCEIGTDRFVLQTLEAEQISDTILDWINDAEVRKYMALSGGAFDFPKLQTLVRGHNNKARFLFWITPRDERERQIGFVQLHLNPIHQLGNVTTCIGAREFWGTGAVGEARGAVMDFAFRKLKIEKLVANCQKPDAGSLWSFSAERWEREAILRRHHRSGTSRVDLIQYAMFRDEWMRRIDAWVEARKSDETEGEG
ncbi:GNAT family N-acetyltransferase [Rhodobacteraceae bacterium NNCM2]|nr:GNAT family N-acetyltransferase [Coraliihabitans acroporae]